MPPLLAHIAKRLLSLLVVLFFSVTITFVLVRTAPGDPFSGEKDQKAEVRAKKLAEYKLDGPLWWQYARYLGDLAKGDLRESTKYKGETVAHILGQSLPVSFQLGTAAFFVAVVGGVTLGVFAAMHRNGLGDYAAMFTALAAISIPGFVTGPVMIFIFALTLGWLPIGGWFEPSRMILPAVCLAAPYVATIARLTRNSLLEVLGQDFIRTATAKGLSRRTVVWKHALRVAILPVVSFLGPLAAHLLTGSLIVETVFGIPGAGQYFVKSIENRDGFLLVGVTIVYCTLVVAFNFLVEIAYTFLDRRIQLHG